VAVALDRTMMTPAQTARLLVWVIPSLVVFGFLVHFLGVGTTTEEIVVVGLVIIALICFLVWLRKKQSE
jgi:uncharacterized membrane protein YecN with MAPEG domain